MAVIPGGGGGSLKKDLHIRRHAGTTDICFLPRTSSYAVRRKASERKQIVGQSSTVVHLGEALSITAAVIKNRTAEHNNITGCADNCQGLAKHVNEKETRQGWIPGRVTVQGG